MSNYLASSLLNFHLHFMFAVVFFVKLLISEGVTANSLLK